MSALGQASLGTQCLNKALGQASLGIFCDGEVVLPKRDDELASAGADFNINYDMIRRDDEEIIAVIVAGINSGII